MNIVDVLLLGCIAAGVFLAVRKIKKNKGGCCGDCSQCSSCSSCKSDWKKEE